MSSVTGFRERASWDVSLELENEGVEGQSLSPAAWNQANLNLSPTTDVSVALYLAEELLGDSGTPTVTIDLSAFFDIEGRLKDASGKRVQALRLQADADNAAAVSIEGGAPDPYELFGAGNAVDVEPGGSILMRLNNQAPVVAAGAKNLKFTFGQGDILKLELLIG